LLLVLLAIIPALGLILYTASEQRRLAAAKVQEEALRLARLASGDQGRLIDGARQLLIGLAQLREVRHRDSRACSALFADLLKQYPVYANLGAIEPDGNTFCSALPLSGRINVADRAYFRRAVETRDFAIGDYQIGRVTGKATVNVGYPVLDASSQVQAVVFAALDLAWLNQLAAKAQLPEGVALIAIEQSGTILAHHPDPEKWVGKSIPEAPIVKTLLAEREGVAEALGPDGIPRLLGFTPLLGRREASDLYVSISIPKAVAFAEVDRMLARNLAGLGIVGLLALVAAWVGGDLFILRRVNALVGATKRLAAGDLSTRTGLPYREGELSQLARGFDEMAESLQRLTIEQAESATQQAKRWEALYRLGQLLSRSLELNDVYPAFAEAVKANLPYDRIGVVVPEGEQLRMTLSVAEPPLASNQGAVWPQTEGTAVAWVLAHKTARVVRDLAREQTFSDDAYIAREGVRATLMLPLLVGGEAVAVFFVDSRTPGAYTERDLELVRPLAEQLAFALQNARLFQELQGRTNELARSVEELKALGEVGQAVSSTLDLQTVLTSIVSHAVQLAVADGGTIYEYDEQAEKFLLRTTHGMEQELIEALRTNPIRLGEGAVGRAAVMREAVEIPDILEAGAYTDRLRDIVARSGFRALLAVPLLREDRILGGLVVRRKSPGKFPPEVVDLLKTFATQSVLAIQNARLFREIEEKGRQLETASKHKSEFLANMSHELRTPLNAILGYTELILDNIYGEVPGKIRDVLQRLEKSGRHLLGLINDVLDLSKIEAGQLTLSLTDYSMKEVVQTVITTVESLAAEKKLALKVMLPPDLPLGRGDERRLTQVLLNLVGNAIKFTAVGEVRVEVTASDGAFLVSVADTGPGIAPADQQKIFEEFQQVDSSSTRQKGGTGLGLAIAKKIIELHAGHIGVESSLGKGSTFWFSLPIRVERRPEAT
jgi:signal transduction histidine kinase/HAMP domain-containing protein